MSIAVFGCPAATLRGLAASPSLRSIALAALSALILAASPEGARAGGPAAPPQESAASAFSFAPDGPDGSPDRQPDALRGPWRAGLELPQSFFLEGGGVGLEPEPWPCRCVVLLSGFGAWRAGLPQGPPGPQAGFRRRPFPQPHAGLRPWGPDRP